MSSTIVQQQQQQQQQMGDITDVSTHDLLQEVGFERANSSTLTTSIGRQLETERQPALADEQIHSAAMAASLVAEDQGAPPAIVSIRRDSLTDGLSQQQHCGDVVAEVAEFILLNGEANSTSDIPNGSSSIEVPDPSLAIAYARSDSLPNESTSTSVTVATYSGVPLEAPRPELDLELGAQRAQQPQSRLREQAHGEDEPTVDRFQHQEARLERSNSCSQAEQCQAQLLDSQLGASLGRNNSNNNISSNSNLSQQKQQFDHHHQQHQQQQQQLSRPQSSSSSSSRFFSSKLNTGSLWSLLSTGSTCSSTNMNDHNQANTSLGSDTQTSRLGGGQQADESIASTASSASLSSSFTSSATNSFLSRYQSFSGSRSKPQQQPHQQQASTVANQVHDQLKRRFRFSIKYIGTSILNKNFTLPMLEWIARDIRRQTVRGAQSTSQRQFTIPTREILLDIQHNQLTAISCKDGHCIFVHPMYCVSKYVQLQHDPTCFAYIIRDAKEAPSFVHVFQAKSANKVHDIFKTIREVTTTTTTNTNINLATAATPVAAYGLAQSRDQSSLAQATASPTTTGLTNTSSNLSNNNNNNRLLQKSASTDGHWRSLLAGDRGPGPGSGPGLGQSAGPQTPIMSSSPPTELGGTGGARAWNHRQQQQQQAAVASSQSEAALQFENSYQFEVMFVKRVKLQCRRVPPTFVDDALETLKSFEVLKGGMESKSSIKGGVGKRIINASVDERQEYDESCQSPPPPPPPQPQVAGPSNQSRSGTGPSLSPSHGQLGIGQLGGSTGSLNSNQTSDNTSANSNGLHQASTHHGHDQFRESKSCQQSPTKPTGGGGDTATAAASPLESSAIANASEQQVDQTQSPSVAIKKHQSMDCLKSIDYTIKSSKCGQAPSYANDFSPYNTITSSDLNERIAAIPVVSGNSVSLDHETRQKLARQVRETIMATAANIKKGVYASGDKLDSTASSKALDSLSCNVASALPSSEAPSSLAAACGPPEANELSRDDDDDHELDQQGGQPQAAGEFAMGQQAGDHRRSSTASLMLQRHQQQSISNNFDLFRRASARQVVKNRTMLLLIGKDELCAISIDKHQILFSKSFNSIVHCLQGNNNRDHFGLICRDSGKINPQTESYAGFVFKCQSEKVVREIMGALKQVIYSSQHNYHGYNSPYNPLNNLNSGFKSQQVKMTTTTTTTSNKQPIASSPIKLHKQQEDSTTSTTTTPSSSNSATTTTSGQASGLSLTMKRGFTKPIELLTRPLEATAGGARISSRSSSLTRNQHQSVDVTAPSSAKVVQPQLSLASLSPPTTAPIMMGGASASSHSHGQANQVAVSKKNPIKSMFCDNCPLYWYHRLCCDIESLPAEASKAIILRRIDCSLTDREQDEVYSRFSEFNIESIDEHNEIFMSILRHQCERKQLKHSSSQSHLDGIAKNQLQQMAIAAANQQQQHGTKQQSSATGGGGGGGGSSAATTCSAANGPRAAGHQRSGSTSGSLAYVLSQTNAANQAASQSIVDASSVAIDNLKKAKNSISVSIENMLKRRSSLRDADESIGGDPQQLASNNGHSATPSGDRPLRSGSFKSDSRASRATEHQQQQQLATATADNNSISDNANYLKRSQSTSDYRSQTSVTNVSQQQFRLPASSWRDSLSRTLNETELSNPLAGLFGVGRGLQRSNELANSSKHPSARGSNESLSVGQTPAELLQRQQHQHGGSPRHQQQQQPGGISPSSVLSGVFWKKSIFDKIRQPASGESATNQPLDQRSPTPVLNTLAPTDTCPAARNIKEQQQQQQQSAHRRRSRDELRCLWRKAILEQITLLKMEKQNQRLQQQATAAKATNGTDSGSKSSKSAGDFQPPAPENDSIQRIKLNYTDVPYVKEARYSWDRLLNQDPTRKVDFIEVARVVRLGVPKQRRGEAWMFLMNQYQIRHGTSFQPADSDYKGDANQTYRSLLSQLSTQQHEIFVDIGRTFPSHPYYSQYLSIGQLSLFNLLKAYSLLDQEVGYCQGLSFVAGILLLHVDSEDEAFELMRHLLFNFGLRKQYLPSMNALHLQLYQLTRLLRDHEFDIFSHFDTHDISPSLYAAPWFLTLFASQFPLGFVARLLDLIFLIGIEAIFRVSLTLLAYHRQSLLNCSNLEATMEFIRNELVQIDSKNLARIFDRSMSLDLRNKLIEYEIEYSFYCAEDKVRSGQALSITKSLSSSSNQAMTMTADEQQQQTSDSETRVNPIDNNDDPTSEVADATATVIIQHLLATNHLKSLRSNYTY